MSSGAGAGAGSGAESVSNFIDGVDVEHLEKTFRQRLQDNPEYIKEVRDKMTESRNPETLHLSTNAQGDREGIKEALSSILRVETKALSKVSDDPDQLAAAFTEMQSIWDEIKAARGAGGNNKIFLIGAGASGRLAIMMKLAMHVMSTEDATLFEAAIAGGDVVFVNAVPRFEDDHEAFLAQLIVQGYEPGDSVIGITASGTANCVKKTLEYAVGNDSHATMICCNNVKKAEKVSGVNYVELPTDSPALSGSTRMHPTTIMMLALSPFLAIAKDKDLDYLKSQITLLTSKIDALPLDDMVAFVQKEAALFDERPIAYRVHSKDPLMMGGVFTDATEQAPTFCANIQLSVAELKKRMHTGEGSIPRTLPIDMSDRKFWASTLADKGKPVALNIDGLSETSTATLEGYDFSHTAYEGVEFNNAVDIVDEGNKIRISGFGEKFELGTEGLDPFFKSLLLKVFLNTHSTTLYARKGYVSGNDMSHLKASNDKLMARTINVVLRHYEAAEIKPSQSCFQKEGVRALYDESLVTEAALACLAEGPLGIVNRTIDKAREMVNSQCDEWDRKVKTGDFGSDASPEDRMSEEEMAKYHQLLPDKDSDEAKSAEAFARKFMGGAVSKSPVPPDGPESSA